MIPTFFSKLGIFNRKCMNFEKPLLKKKIPSKYPLTTTANKQKLPRLAYFNVQRDAVVLKWRLVKRCDKTNSNSVTAMA